MNISFIQIQCFQDLFDARVEESPDEIAVVFEEQQISYLELNRRANHLAHHLIMLGVAPEVLVGIYVKRSIDMIIGILGVLKAGGAYVPLDPVYPQERLAFILDDAKIQVLITQAELLDSLPKRLAHVVCLDEDWAEIAEKSDASPKRTACAENLAYVIYTSGSTGRPKGVMITHSNLCHFVQIASQALGVTLQDIYLQTASISYALSVRQMMIPLVVGATIVIAASEQTQDPLSLFELIKRKQITLMDMVPSFWRACIQRLSDLPANESKKLLDNSLRRIVSIGEPLAFDLPYDWAFRLGHKAQLVNIFGQTETTGMVATYPIPHDAHPPVGIVPIGHSIPETKIYILDTNLVPVPLGELGELCISNPCLASGYLNRPELTAEKFIPNPFDDGLNSHLYRTGDLARQCQDGNIEYLGRGDYQVKIRGQRLELGEVESAIRAHTLVHDCVVTARGDHPDEKYLVAYIVASDKSLTSSDVRDFLRFHLPDYMVPSVFVFLESLPLTPNGKVNRLDLPDPSAVPSSYQTSVSYEGPRNPIEQTIANIWKSLLNLDCVGIHDDYFDLGGHSLMSVRMFTWIERDLGVRLPLTTLFQATTIAELAKLVANVTEEITQWKIVVPVQPRGGKPPFFGVHGQEGGVLFWRDLVAYLPNNQPFYAIQALGVDGLQSPLKRIPDMAALYIREMHKVQPHGPFYIGGYSLGGEIAFEMAQQLVSQGEKVDLLVLFDTPNPKRAIRPMRRVSEGSVIPELDAPHPLHRYTILKQKLKGHYLRLSMLSPLQGIAYILNQIEVHARRAITSALVKLFRTTGRRLPDFLLLRYLRQSHSEALANYVPTVYPGKITLFRATETLALNSDDSPLGWGPLAVGGMDVYHFEASHEIFNAQYAKEVAQKLDEQLKIARGE